MSFLTKKLIKNKIKKTSIWEIIGFLFVCTFWGYLAYSYIYSLIYDTKETLILSFYFLLVIAVIYCGCNFQKILNEKERIEWNKYKGLLETVNGIGIIMFSSLAIIGVSLFKYLLYSNQQMGYVALYSTILFLFSMVTYFALVYKFDGAINLLRGFLIIGGFMILARFLPFIYYRANDNIIEFFKQEYAILIITGIAIALVLKGLVITTSKRILALYSNRQTRFINILILTFIGMVLVLPILFQNK